MSTSIYLLDVDGVLLHPGGYREALKRTINHFSRAMGWGDCAPEDSTALVFEAHGITNEWDMCAICLAALFVAAWQHVSDLQLPRSVPDALAVVQKYGVPPQQVDFAQTARDVSAQMRSGARPALAAPFAFSLALNSSPKSDSRSNLTALLDEIFSTTHDIHRSHTLPVFSTYAQTVSIFYMLPNQMRLNRWYSPHGHRCRHGKHRSTRVTMHLKLSWPFKCWS